LDLGPALVLAVAHRFPQRRLPPRGSVVTDVSLVTLLSIRYRLASLRRHTKVCMLPLSHSGWVSAPRSPPRLHRAPIPFGQRFHACADAPSGLLRGLPGDGLGHPFHPFREFPGGRSQPHGCRALV